MSDREVSNVGITAGRGPVEARRELMRGLLSCLLCGRSSGHLGAGAMVCTRCRPSRLRRWLDAVGFSVAELATFARVSRDTVQVALRGAPIGKRAAERLAKVTKFPVADLRAGQE